MDDHSWRRREVRREPYALRTGVHAPRAIGARGDTTDDPSPQGRIRGFERRSRPQEPTSPRLRSRAGLRSRVHGRLRTEPSRAERVAKGRSGRRAGIAIVIAIALAVAGVLVSTAMGADAADDRSTKSRAKHPNILMIMTDDQTVAAMRVLPAVKSLIGAAGVTFTDNIVSFPICCPSRASFLTGEYADNDGVHANVAPYGGLVRSTAPRRRFPSH